MNFITPQVIGHRGKETRRCSHGVLACLSLAQGERILSTLNLGYWEPHSFDAETRSFLDLMARNAAIATENTRLYQLSIDKARKYCRGCLSAASSSAWSWDR